MRTLYRLIQNYKLYGILIFLKLKLGLTDSINVKGLKHPIRLRSSTSDIPTFAQVFIGLEYEFKIDFSPRIIIDLGANIGLGSLYFTQRYPDSRIIAIEPEPSNFELLQINTSHYDNITPLNYAISNVDNEMVEIMDNGRGNWGFMTKTIENNENHTSSIRTITIDTLIDKYNIDHIDILKIDIEGAEKELFSSNCENWLSRTKCLVIELHDNMKKGTSKTFFQKISQYEFSMNLKGENLIFINDNF